MTSRGSLCFHAWKLSSDSSARQAFARLQSLLLQMPGNLQHVLSGNGQDSSFGIMEGILLHARPLFVK